MLDTLTRLVEIARRDGLTAVPTAVGRYRRNRQYAAHGNLYQAVRRGRFAPALGILSSRLLGWNAYKEFLRWRRGNPVEVWTNGYPMLVDLDEPGLHDDLCSYGEREVHSTRAFAAELRRLRASTDGPITVLEVGGHVGYFALLEASLLGDRADIHAFEPSPENYERLVENVGLNGFEDRFTLNPIAAGATTDSVELAIGVQSNQSYVVSEHVSPESTRARGDRVTVELRSIDDYLVEHDIAPEDVDVLRMDAQGGEYDILAGACSLLAAESDLVCFIETHPDALPAARQAELVGWLADAGFEPVHTARGFRTPATHPELRVDSVWDLRETNAEVILRRERPTDASADSAEE